MITLWLVLVQCVYYLLLHDDARDDLVWDACLYPERHPTGS